MNVPNRKTLYAITHVSRKTGLRTLTFANQGRNHFPTQQAAREHLDAVQTGGGLASILDPAEYLSLETRAVECYDHGDAVGIYFDEPSPVGLPGALRGKRLDGEA